MDIEYNYLKKTHEREQDSSEARISRLNLIISHL